MDSDTYFFTLFLIFRHLFISVVSTTSVRIILVISWFIKTSGVPNITIPIKTTRQGLQTNLHFFSSSCLLSLSLSSSCWCCWYSSELKRSLFSILANKYKTRIIRRMMNKLTLMIYFFNDCQAVFDMLIKSYQTDMIISFFINRSLWVASRGALVSRFWIGEW
jgi:hypothetical protein